MADSEPIYQCSDCGRFFSRPGSSATCHGEGQLVVVPRPGGLGALFAADLLLFFVCGLADCAGIKASLLAEERARALREAAPALEDRRRFRQWAIERRQKARGGAVRKNADCRMKKDSLPDAPVHDGHCDRGMPPERDVLVVGSSQVEFRVAVDVSVADGVLLDYFQRHYGEWVPMVLLAEVSGCHAVHSRMPEVRGLLPRDHDIDQESRLYEPTGKVHSHYRLCLKSDSVRLRRKGAAASASGQQELASVQQGAEVVNE